MASSCERRLKAWFAGAGSLCVLLAGCASTPQPRQPSAAERNAASLYSLPIDLFGRPETGWAVYAPRAGATLGTDSPADGDAFAQALARWQARHGEPASGIMDAATLTAMKRQWQSERDFIALRAKGVCPPPPDPADLADAAPSESYGGRPLQAGREALAAYRRLRADALAHAPVLARDPERLQIFSAYRSPERDAARCEAEKNCQGVVRAACSAHRTGLALDLVLDTAPGYPVDSSADVNRLTMVRGFAYRWLLANAPRYGFVNYAFEPWHWEWTGASLDARTDAPPASVR